MRRREVLAGGMIAIGAVLAGCQEAVVPDEISEAAEPAQVGEATLEETGYEHESTEEIEIDDTVSVGGETVDYQVTNWVSTYTTQAEGVDAEADVAGFVVLTTPDIRIAGQQANPVGTTDRDELARDLADRLDQPVGDLEQVGEESVEIAGETSASIVQYETTTETEGESVPALVHAARGIVGDDWVVVGASHPTVMDESDAIATLAEGIVYPADV